ncbi:glycosyl transferase, family 2 domain protein [Burkholderia mallei]|nr:glycosyl transferase, family 2 domain protein [Burkholderia mallei]
MDDGELRRVDERPAGRREVEREQGFLAADEKARMIAARRAERAAPERGRAGEQAENRRARLLRRVLERARAHQRAGGVLAALDADEHARGQRADARMAFEELRGERERAGLPPRVVVAERDVRRARARGAEVASGRAEIARRAHERRAREAPPHHRRGAVVRRIVDDDDRGLLGQLRELRERARELGFAAVREHDRGHARLARRHVDARGRYADEVSHWRRQ